MGTHRDRRQDERPETLDARSDLDVPTAEDDEPSVAPTLAGVSVAGFTRRRVAFVLAAALTLWVVIVFARQVGDATAAGVRADRMRDANAALSANVASLERERELIQRQEYIALAARAYGLGAARDREFVLAADAPPLAATAPGSAALRLGSQHVTRSPLDSWLTVLFGPAPSS